MNSLNCVLLLLYLWFYVVKKKSKSVKRKGSKVKPAATDSDDYGFYSEGINKYVTHQLEYKDWFLYMY